VQPFSEEDAVPGAQRFIAVSNHGHRKSGSSNELANTKWQTPAEELGELHTYNRMFIDGFVHIAQPLMRQTEKKQTFEWSSEVETAFQSLKKYWVRHQYYATRKQESSGPSVPVVSLRKTAVGLEKFEEGTNVKERKVSEVPNGNSKTSNINGRFRIPL